MVEKTNQNCEVKDTAICNFLGCDGCEKCTLSTGFGRGTDPRETAGRWDETLTLIPKEVDDLHMTNTCVFCGQEEKAAYAELSLGHIEPEYKKGIILGLGKKVRCEIGSLVDIPLACCKSCKKKMVMQDVLQYAIVLAFVAIAIVLLSIPSVSKALEEIHFIMPLTVVIAIVVLGWIISKFAVKRYIRHCEKSMLMNPMEIPTIKKMVNIGWFPTPEVKSGYPRVHFAKKKPRENFRYFSE